MKTFKYQKLSPTCLLVELYAALKNKAPSRYIRRPWTIAVKKYYNSQCSILLIKLEQQKFLKYTF